MTRFYRDEEGSILVFSLVLLILLFAFMGLVVDSGRSMIAHSRVQGYVDSVTFAAAAELDGESDSTERARAAIRENFLRKASLAGTNGGEEFAVDEIMFLDGDPQLTSRVLSDADVTRLKGMTVSDSNATEATHVVVVGSSVDVDWGLLSFVNSIGSVNPNTTATVRTWSVGTLRQRSCSEPLVAMCAPPDNDWEEFDPGTQLRLTKDRDEVWDGSEYRLVTNISDDVSGTCEQYSGVDQLHCLLAINTHDTTCDSGVVNVTADGGFTAVGQDEFSVHASLNTRFGIFDPILGGIAVEPEVSADANTISGSLYSCTAEDLDAVSKSMGLPIDECFNTGECDIYSDPIGIEQLHHYWEANHPGTPYPDGLTTRFQIYQYETLAGLLDPEGPEDSTTNICNPNATPIADRRTFDVAIVDCSALGDGETFENLEPLEVVEVLLSEPVARTDAITFDGDFQGDPLLAGDVVSTDFSPLRGNGRSIDPYAAQGVTFGLKPAIGAPADVSMPMLFDTANPTGGDEDLTATDRGNILIISEDGDSSDPDDSRHGGWILIHFDEPTFVESMLVFDTEEGGVVRLYDHIETDPTGEFETIASTGELKPHIPGQEHDPDELSHRVVPHLGDGNHIQLDINESGVRTIAYFMPDSGGIDDIVVNNSLIQPMQRDSLSLEVVQTLDASNGGEIFSPILTN